MKNKHLLSICIPTNGVSRWVIPTIRNLYSLGADINTFEVVVADNGGEYSDLANAIKEFESHTNFRYVQTNVKGFYNIIENFSLANGDYMIKLNHRCILHKGMIEYINEVADRYYSEKPLMFFSNGNIRIGSIKEYTSFDDFMYDFSYWSSLSEGLFFWKEDMYRIPYIKFAKMSPNVSLLFDSRVKSKFILVDTKICHDQDAKGKYGYDLFDTFAVQYLDLINEQRLDGYISKRTFLKIKKDILMFLEDIYISMKCYGKYENYSLAGMKESLSIYFSATESFFLRIRALLLKYPISIVKNILRRFVHIFKK